MVKLSKEAREAIRADAQENAVGAGVGDTLRLLDDYATLEAELADSKARIATLELENLPLSMLRTSYQVHKALVEAAGCETIEQLAEQRDSAIAELAKLRAGQEPVAAQVRFRRPEKGLADWSVWQQTTIKPNMPAWSIDSAGYEDEYRLLYTAPQPSAVPDGVRKVIDYLSQSLNQASGGIVPCGEQAIVECIALLGRASAPAAVQGDESLPGEALGHTCADGGKCHHKCERRCFRRESCAPFSNYTGPWRYSNENEQEDGKA